MLVGCVAGRFAATLAMATLRKHALSGTQGFHCVVVFYLWFIEQNYRTDRLFFFCFHVCEHLRLQCCNEQCMLLFSLDEVDRRQLFEQEKCLETFITKSRAGILNSLFYGGPEGSHMQIKNSTCKLKIVHAN